MFQKLDKKILSRLGQVKEFFEGIADIDRKIEEKKNRIEKEIEARRNLPYQPNNVSDINNRLGQVRHIKFIHMRLSGFLRCNFPAMEMECLVNMM